MAERGGPALRLDVFLWYARLAKTRTAARDLVVTGRLRLDGRLVERVHVPVRVGSILVYAHGGVVRALRVEMLPARRGPASEARACYSDLTLQEDGARPLDTSKNVSQQAPLD